MISTDVFVKPGTEHTICEDHVGRDFRIEDVVVVSDGCGSGVSSEIGAMLTSRIALKVFNKLYSYDSEKIDPSVFKTAFLEDLEKVRSVLDIYHDSLMATLIIAYRHKQHVHVIAYGDGVIFGRYRATKKVSVFNIDYIGNAPYYPVYDSSFSLKCGYVSAFTSETEFTKVVTTYDDGVQEDVTNYLYNTPIEIVFDLCEFDCVLIGSDGMCSFQGPDAPNVNEIAQTFVDFKGMEGKFLQRRVGKTIKRLQNDGITHYDDISVAAIYVDDEELSCLNF